jgi:hypothetical protein
MGRLVVNGPRLVGIKEVRKMMVISLADLAEAGERLASGERAYEFKTSDSKLRLLGPACGFGADCLQRYRRDGLYAESMDEARHMAQAKSATITGVWFVKH